MNLIALLLDKGDDPHLIFGIYAEYSTAYQALLDAQAKTTGPDVVFYLGVARDVQWDRILQPEKAMASMEGLSAAQE